MLQKFYNTCFDKMFSVGGQIFVGNSNVKWGEMKDSAKNHNII